MLENAETTENTEVKDVKETNITTNNKTVNFNIGSQVKIKNNVKADVNGVTITDDKRDGEFYVIQKNPNGNVVISGGDNYLLEMKTSDLIKV